MPDTYIPTAADVAADQAANNPQPYIPTAADAKASDSEWYGSSAADPYGDPADQAGQPALPSTVTPAPAAAPPAPALNAIQKMLGLGNTHGTIYNDLKANYDSVKGIPKAVANFGQNVLSGTLGEVYSSQDPDSAGRKATDANADAVGSTLASPITGPIDATFGPQSMLGHGAAAVQSGKVKNIVDFAKSVGPGIENETVQHPIGQLLNVISLVSAGEMSLSAGAEGLAGQAARMDAAAAAATTAEDAAMYGQMADRARQAAQNLRIAAFQVHRGATGGPIGDVVRDATATAAEKIMPGSKIAQSLRASADTQRIGAALLKARAQYNAQRAAAQKAAGARQDYSAGGAVNVGTPPPAPGTPAQLPAPQDVPPPAPPAEGQPIPPAPNPLAPQPTPPAPAPGPQPTPTTEPMANPVGNPPELAPAPVVPGTEPTPATEGPDPIGGGKAYLQGGVSNGGFRSTYQDTFSREMKANTDLMEQARAPRTIENAVIARDKTIAQLRPMFDPATGLLGQQPLLDTIQKAIEHGQKTQEPTLYFSATPSVKNDPLATRALADHLASATSLLTGTSGDAHVSFYTPDGGKTVGGVFAGPDPAALTSALAAAAASAQQHQDQTGQSKPGQPAMSYGVATLQPGMTPQDAIKIASAQAKQGTNTNGQSAGQSAGQPAAGTNAGVAQPQGGDAGSVVGGPGGSAAQEAGNVSGGSQVGPNEPGVNEPGVNEPGVRDLAAAGAQQQPATGGSEAPAQPHAAQHAEPGRDTGANGSVANGAGASAADASAEPGDGRRTILEKPTLGPYSSFEANGDHFDNLEYDPHYPDGTVSATHRKMLEGYAGVPILGKKIWQNVAHFERATGHKLYLEPQGKGETVAQLSSEEKETVAENLAKVADDPHVGQIAREAAAEVAATGATKPKEDMGAGLRYKVGDEVRFPPTGAEGKVTKVADHKGTQQALVRWTSGINAGAETTITDTGRYLEPATKEKTDANNAEHTNAEHARTPNADAVRSDGPAPVGGGEAENVRRTQKTRETADSPDRGAADVQTGGTEPDGPGVSTERSGGNRPASVSVPAERAGNAEAGTRPSGEGRPARSSTALAGGEQDTGGDDADTPQQHYAGHALADYHASSEDAIGRTGLAGKERDLITAVRLLKKIEDEDRLATPDEQKVLIKYPGLGWTGNSLNTRKVGNSSVLDALSPLVTEKELNSIKGATLNSHYTSPDVINAMWDWVQASGFLGGKVLEPSAGIGLFLAFMPRAMRDNSKVRAVELDSITGRILRQLQQTARVDIGGFEKQALASNYYDLTISNVPFGPYAVNDPQFNRLGLPSAFSSRIHNFFFVKGIRATRPGGVMAFITTHGTLDSGGTAETVRQFLAEEAELLGGIRLPNNAFRGNAATDVTTDILFFQKKGNDTAPTGETFQNTVNVGTEDAPIMVNEYFARHPEFVLGTHSMQGKMRRGDGTEYTLMPFEGEDLGESLRGTIHKLPLAIFKPYAHKPTNQVKRNEVEGLQEDARRGRFLAGAVARTAGGEVAVIQPGGVPELVTDQAIANQLGHYMDIRDSLLKVLQDQQDGVDDAALAKSQGALKKAYDTYTKKYARLGVTRGKGHNGPWIDDPDAQNVLALEVYRTERGLDASGKVTRKQVFERLSDQFTKRTQLPRMKPTVAAGAREALVISLRETSRVDLPRMEQLTGMPAATLLENLSGVVFQDPVTEKYVLADEYGSGNVRQKLAEAEMAAASNPKLKPNVAYLESVQPKNLNIGQISVKLGAPWVPKDLYAEFAVNITGLTAPKIQNVSTDRQFKWSVEGYRGATTLARSTYGTADTDEHAGAHALDLMELAMNGQVPKLFVGRGDERRADPEGTAAAQAKQDKIKAEWKRWVRAEPERAARLEDIYNREVNVLARRRFDGVQVYAQRDEAGNVMYRHDKNGNPDPTKPLLVFEGMNPMISLRIHQANAVYRGLQQDNTLWAHEVGTGKTFTGVTLAMEMRRLGIRNKPMILVKPRTLPQIANDFMKLYPGAKILVGDDEMVKGAANRQRFMARVATGDWDCVIVSHNTLNLLPMHPEAITSFYEEQIAQQRQYLELAEKEAGRNSERDFTVKEIERAIRTMEVALEKELEKIAKQAKDANLFFEEMGVDHLIVDEAQKYKNMTVLSARGMGKAGAPFATDFYIKLRHVQTNGGGATFMTGTPLTNSISEMHTLMRCLAPNTLEESGLMAFDAFAAQYADMVTKLERKADLSYDEKTRMGTFSNIPELMNLYTSFTDTMLAKDVPELVRPHLINDEGDVTDKPIVVLSKPNPYQRAYYIEARRRMRAIKYPIAKGDDTPVSIGTDVRLASLDVRLRWRGAPDLPDSKINQVVQKVHEQYSLPHCMENKRTQLVFLDLGIDELYPDIKNKLVDLGIPAKEIAFISDAGNEDQLEDLFEDVKEGNVRVLIGSREKMGVGVNVQDRLWAIHQVDPTYRPDQMEQADGRILRHGNLFHDMGVKIYQYVNQNSGDSFMWNKVAAKAQYIAQVTQGTAEMREAEDIEGDNELSQQEIDAIADGNPHLIELQQARHDREQLEMVEKSDAEAKEALRKTALYQRDTAVPAARAAVAKMEKAMAYVEANKPAKFAMTVEGKEYGADDRGKAAEALWKAALDVPTWGRGRPIGVYRGYTVKAEVDNTQEKPQLLFTLVPTTSNNESLILKRFRDHYEKTSPTGLIQVIDNTLESYPVKIAAAQKAADANEAEIPKQFAEAAKPFDDVDKLAALKQKETDLRRKVDAAAEEGQKDEALPKFGPENMVKTKAAKESEKRNAPVEVSDASKAFYRNSPGGFVPIAGTMIKMPPELAHYDVFVCKRKQPGAYDWWAIEAHSGASVANANTKAEVTAQAIAKIGDDPERFDAAITRMVEKNGLSPRYAGAQAADDDAPPTGSQDARAVNSAGGSSARGPRVTSKGNAAQAPAPAPTGSKLMREDVTPAVQAMATKIVGARDQVLAVLSPASLDNAGPAARSFREHSAAQAQALEIAHNELKQFGLMISGGIDWKGKRWVPAMSSAKRLAFYDLLETGGKQPTPELQALADMLRKIMDDDRDQVRALGTGKLQSFLTDYAPHYYKNLNKAREFYAQHYGQRGLNASSSFLKQRKYDTLGDAIAAGLEPLTDNPIELVLMKHNEMQRYIMAQKVLGDIKGNPALSAYVAKDDGHAPGTWQPLAGTEVWKGSEIQVKEAYDKLVMDSLDGVLTALNVQHTRKASLSGGQAWGRATGRDKIETKFGGPESILIHELGHIIDTRYKAWEFLNAPGLRVPGVQRARVKISQELKDLADLRFEGQPQAGPAYRQYVRQRGEKVANAIAAMIYAPEKMQAVAPTVLLRLRRLLGQHPELRPILDIKPSLVIGERQQGLDVGGRILAGQYFAPPEVARIYNNYLSPGLHGNVLYDALRFMGNAMNQAQLGLSGFHFMFTMNDAMISQLSVGVKRGGVGLENLIRGTATLNKAQVATGARQIAMAPLDMLKAPFAVPIYLSRGAKFQREYYHPGTQGQEMAAIVDAAIAGGARVKMDSHYKNDAVSLMWKSLRTAGERFRGGNPVGGVMHGAAALARSPFALVEATAKPLMETWVPLMKAGAVASLLQTMIEDLPAGSNVSRDDLRAMAARAVDAVDDRMGQLNYDNLFWNKVFKDALMGSVRSVGWNVGSLRIIAGGAYDVASTPKRLLSGGKGGGGGNTPPPGQKPPGGAGGGGNGGFDYNPVVTDRIAYMVALAFAAALMGALYQWLHTGEAPHDLKDCYFPRTGKNSDNGKPERVQMATYIKDVHGYVNQPAQTVANKLHPVLSTIADAWENKDYFGTEIRNADDPLVKQAADTAKYALTQFEPFSYTNAVKNGTNVMSERGAENFFGITPAPKDLDYTAAEKMMLRYLHQSTGDTRTQAQASKSAARRDAVQKGRAGADIRAMLRGEVVSGDLTRREARADMKASRESWQVQKFKTLTAEQALRVFEAGTPAEKRAWSPYLRRKEKGQTRQFDTKATDAIRAMLR